MARKWPDCIGLLRCTMRVIPRVWLPLCVLLACVPCSLSRESLRLPRVFGLRVVKAAVPPWLRSPQCVVRGVEQAHQPGAARPVQQLLPGPGSSLCGPAAFALCAHALLSVRASMQDFSQSPRQAADVLNFDVLAALSTAATFGVDTAELTVALRSLERAVDNSSVSIAEVAEHWQDQFAALSASAVAAANASLAVGNTFGAVTSFYRASGYAQTASRYADHLLPASLASFKTSVELVSVLTCVSSVSVSGLFLSVVLVGFCRPPRPAHRCTRPSSPRHSPWTRRRTVRW